MIEDPASSAAPPAPPPAPTGSITLGFQQTGRVVAIPEHAARILVQLLDRINLTGSDLKFSVALAQRAIEEGITVMEQTPIPAVVPNRAARRQQARTPAGKNGQPTVVPAAVRPE